MSDTQDHEHDLTASMTEPLTIKQIIGDFSLPQIIATGLAAATSFALSAQIGIAGSIIGSVVGAVASAVASQIYRNILTAADARIRSIGSGLGVAADKGTSPSASDRISNEACAPAPLDQTRTEVSPSPEDTWIPRSVSGRASIEEVAETGTPIVPTSVREAARTRRQKAILKRVTIGVVAVAVASVLIYAAVVNLATDGEGITWEPPAQTSQGTGEVEQTQPNQTSDEGTTTDPENETDSDPAEEATPEETDPTDGDASESSEPSDETPMDTTDGGTEEGPGESSESDPEQSGEPELSEDTSPESEDSESVQSPDGAVS